jgi:hypothetical protein
MNVRGDKLSGDPQIGQPVCYELGQEPFFSGVEYPLNSVDDSVKGCHIQGLPREAYGWRTWTGMESVHVMCIRFPL